VTGDTVECVMSLFVNIKHGHLSRCQLSLTMREDWEQPDGHVVTFLHIPPKHGGPNERRNVEFRHRKSF